MGAYIPVNYYGDSSYPNQTAFEVCRAQCLVDIFSEGQPFDGVNYFCARYYTAFSANRMRNAIGQSERVDITGLTVISVSVNDTGFVATDTFASHQANHLDENPVWCYVVAAEEGPAKIADATIQRAYTWVINVVCSQNSDCFGQCIPQLQALSSHCIIEEEMTQGLCACESNLF